jgi:hypothetical protein
MCIETGGEGRILISGEMKLVVARLGHDGEPIKGEIRI